MVRVTVDAVRHALLLEAVVVTYGNASDPAITRQVAEEIESMWNEPGASVLIQRVPYTVRFRVEHRWMPGIEPETILANTDPG